MREKESEAEVRKVIVVVREKDGYYFHAYFGPNSVPNQGRDYSGCFRMKQSLKIYI